MRTKILVALAALLPASIVITRLQEAAVIRQARENGDLGAWVDPGPLFYLLLFVGFGCFIAAVISVVTDVRHHK
jgi:hypothetical protein